MTGIYSCTGDSVEDIKKKKPFIWKFRGELYAVSQNKCKKIPVEDVTAHICYERYESSLTTESEIPTMMCYSQLLGIANLYSDLKWDDADFINIVFNELSDDEVSDLDVQLRNYIELHNEYKKQY